MYHYESFNLLQMIYLIQQFRNAKLSLQGGIAFIALGLYFISSYFLEKSYMQSQFPVSYFEQQTSFNAPKMKEWYAYMIDQGTFELYIQTQLIDFLFIATVIFAGFTLWSFTANLHPKTHVFNTWGQQLAFALPIAGIFDVLENLVSLIMIENPVDFAASIVIPYSTFAVLKFTCWAVGLVWLLLSIVALPIIRIRFKKATVV